MAAVLLVASIAASIYFIVSPNVTIPTLSITKGLNTLLNSIAFAMVLVCFCFSVVAGRAKPAPVFIKALLILIWCGIFALASILLGRFMEVLPPSFVLLIALAVAGAVSLAVYLFRRKRASDAVSSNSIRKSAAGSGEIKYAYSILYGSLIAMLPVGALYFFRMGYDTFILLPLAATLVGLIVWRVCKWRGILIISAAAVAVFGIIYIYGSVASYGFRAAGTVLPFEILYLTLIFPLVDLYCRREENV